MRTFIAVPAAPSRELKQLLRRLGLMGHAIKPVRAEQMHITVKFLGEIDEARVAEVANVLSSVCAGLTPHRMELKGLGVFPDRRRPAVLWAGVVDPSMLMQLEAELSSQLEPLGYPRERRPFHPHLTLARVKAKPPREFFDMLDEHAVGDWGISEADRVILYQSEPAANGPRYIPLATSELMGS